MTTAYIILDSGGSRTTGSVDIDGDGVLDRGFQIPDVISGVTPRNQYANTLRKIFSRAESAYEEAKESRGIEITDAYVFIASAGFSGSTRQAFLDTLDEVTPDYFEGKVRAAGAINDGTALLIGNDADAAIIAGTGSTVMLRDQDGSIQISGGHDWVGCDYGSGFWIGLQGIRQAGRDFENRRRSSTLLERFQEEYTNRSTDPEKFIAALGELAIADLEMKGKVARFAEAVCKAARSGDEDAQDIVKAEAEDLANITAGAVRRNLAHKIGSGIHIALGGSVIGNEFYRRIFEEHVRTRLTSDSTPHIEWQLVDNSLTSIYLLARRLEDDPDFIRSVKPNEFKPVVAYFR